MSEGETFEERVSADLDALYDGAALLTGEPARAEALIVSVVVEAARATNPPEDPEEFRKWILGRLVRHHLAYVDAIRTGEESAASSADGEPGSSPAASETLVDDLARWEAAAPDRLNDLIRRAIGGLPLRERAALWLVNVIDFRYTEAAAALDVRLSRLRELLYRARHELQLRMAVALRAAPRNGRDVASSSGGGEST